MSIQLPVLGGRAQDEAPTEVHDWEGKENNVLVLNYTMACALACDFCCYGCHPKRKEKMPLELALRLVAEAGELGVFSSVAFTGGEPLLCLDELLIVGDLLRRLRLPFTIATACHWADTPRSAHDIVNSLADRGLCRLNISHDPSHAKFVPAEYVRNACRAASERGIPTYVVGTFYSAGDSLATFLPGVGEMPFVKTIDKYVAPVGRATKKGITQKTYDLDLRLDDLCCYRRVHHDIVVFYDGTVYPCCSTFNRATPGIAVGNANELSLRELWERTEGSLMLRIMKRQGFARFYEVVRDLDPELHARLPDVRKSVGPCSLCNQIFKDATLNEQVRRVFDRYENAKVDSVVDYMVEMFGETTTMELLESVSRPASHT